MPRDAAALNDFFQREHVWAKACVRTWPGEEEPQKRRLGNFVLLEPSVNASVKDSRIEAKLAHYVAHDQRTQAGLTMVRRLVPAWDQARAEVEPRHDRRRERYWLEVHARFLDIREKHLIDFALAEWAVPYAGEHVRSVTIDSLKGADTSYEVEREIREG